MPVTSDNYSSLLAQRKRNVYLQVQKSKGSAYSQIDNKSFGYDTLSLISSQRGLDKYLATETLSISVSGTLVFQGTYNISTLDLNALKIAFARQFGVTVSQVTIVVSTGSVVIDYTLTVTPAQASSINALTQPGTAASSFTSSLLSSINSSNITGLSLTPNVPAFVSTIQLVTTVASGFTNLCGICPDNLGNLYVADATTNAIYKVVLSTGATTTVANTGLSGPCNLYFDNNDNIYVADVNNSRIAKVVVSTGVVTTLASGLTSPCFMCSDGAGNIFVINGFVVSKVVISTGVVTTLASGFSEPFAICYDGDGKLYVADAGSNTIYKIVISTGSKTSIATGFDASSGGMSYKSGYLYLAQINGFKILKVSVTTGVSTLVTTQTSPGNRDGNYSTSRFNSLTFSCIYGSSLYVCDNGSTYSIRRVIIDLNTEVTTLATGFTNLCGICPGETGNLYVADATTNAIYKVVVSSGATTTVANTGLSGPCNLYFDGSGNLFVAEAGNNRISKVVVSTGVITTLASGFASPCYMCSDGAGNLFVINGFVISKVVISSGTVTTLASGFFEPFAICYDGAGKLYVADAMNGGMVHSIVISTGVSTHLFTGISSAFGGMSYKSEFLYFGVNNSNKITKVSVNTGIEIPVTVQSLPGNKDGDYTVAKFNSPSFTCIDGSNLYVCDNGDRIRTVIIPA